MRRWFRNARGEIRSGWKAGGYVLLLAGFVVLLNLGAKGLERVFGPALKAAINQVGPLLPVLLALGASAVCLRLERRPLASIGLRIDRRWLGAFLLGTAGGVVLMAAVALAVRATGAFHWERNAAWGAGQLLSGAWVYLWAATFEELVFRGYPFQRLLQGGLGPARTLALFAVFFGIAHWGNPGLAGTAKAWATLNIALAAVLLGLAWLRTGSLALPIGIHLGWNWCQGELLGFQVSGTGSGGFLKPLLRPDRPDWLHGGAFGLEGTLICALACAGACLLLGRWRGTAARA